MAQKLCKSVQHNILQDRSRLQAVQFLAGSIYNWSFIIVSTSFESLLCWTSFWW